MAYTKQTVGPGDVITSFWGNHIQTQYDEALADAFAAQLELQMVISMGGMV